MIDHFQTRNGLVSKALVTCGDKSNIPNDMSAPQSMSALTKITKNDATLIPSILVKAVVHFLYSIKYRRCPLIPFGYFVPFTSSIQPTNHNNVIYTNNNNRCSTGKT